jgi:hypothetical protein
MFYLASRTARNLFILATLVVALLFAGCASAPERVLSEKTPSYATLPNGHDPLNPDQLSPVYAALTSGSDKNLVRALERKRGHALNVPCAIPLRRLRTVPSVPVSSLVGAKAVNGPSLISSAV